MFCTKCGSKNLDGTMYCVVCGTPMTGGKTENVAPQSDPGSVVPEPVNPIKPKRKKKKIKAVIIIAVILAVIIGLVVTAFCLLGANISPKATVARIEEAAKDVDAEEAMYALVPKGAKYIIVDQYFDGDEEAFEDALEDVEDEVEESLAISGIDVKRINLVGDLKDADEEMDEQIKSEMGELYGIPVNEVKSGKVKVTYKQFGEKYEEKVDCYFYRTLLGWSIYYPDWEYAMETFSDRY